jgi:hypothetical protein
LRRAVQVVLAKRPAVRLVRNIATSIRLPRRARPNDAGRVIKRRALLLLASMLGGVLDLGAANIDALQSPDALIGGRAAARAQVALGLHAGRDDGTEQYDQFGLWIGRRVFYRVVFCDATSWDGIASPWFLAATRRWIESDPARVEVLSLPLVPKGSDGGFASIVRGERDAHFLALAGKLQARNLAERVIVRLGWEGNGDWYPWSYVAEPAGYRDAFRRVVQIMKRVAPGLRFEWCISCRATPKTGVDWREGYPGDDVVDIVSMDVYDEWTPTWEEKVNGGAGLHEFRAFAIAHDKPEAYPEWSCSTSSHGNGDNAAFIQHMANWFAERPGGVLYQAYWNSNSGAPRAAVQTAAGARVPLAAAAYLSLFGVPATPQAPEVR